MISTAKGRELWSSSGSDDDYEVRAMKRPHSITRLIEVLKDFKTES